MVFILRASIFNENKKVLFYGKSLFTTTVIMVHFFTFFYGSVKIFVVLFKKLSLHSLLYYGKLNQERFLTIFKEDL